MKEERISSSEILDLLQKMGLTEYESKIYSILVEKGVCNAKQISKFGNVPLTRVYETLDSMKKGGLVVAQEGRPKKYRVPSLDSLKNVIAKKKRKLEQEVEETRKTYEKVRRLLPTPSFSEIEKGERKSIWVMEGSESSFQDIKRRIENAVKSIWNFSGDLSWFSRMPETVKKAAKRGVEIKILCDVNKITKPRIRELTGIGAKIREWNGQKLRGDIIDDEKLALVFKTPRPGVDREKSYGKPGNNKLFRYERVMSENPIFIKAMKNYFNFWWEKGNRIE